jgi:ribose 5-phosphate isomerase B
MLTDFPVAFPVRGPPTFGPMRFGITADHAGFELRGPLARQLRALGHEVVDFGPTRYAKDDDYPDVVAPLAEAVAGGEVERGVAVCGSGVGACIVANKIAGVRASVCHDTYSARQGVEHDDMNVLVIGARVIGPELIAEIVRAFAGARFSGEERHIRRLEKLRQLEARFCNSNRPSETA